MSNPYAFALRAVALGLQKEGYSEQGSFDILMRHRAFLQACFERNDLTMGAITDALVKRDTTRRQPEQVTEKGFRSTFQIIGEA